MHQRALYKILDDDSEQGVSCRKSAAYKTVCEHFEKGCNTAMGHQMHYRNSSSGVTLIELIVAMGILTILVSGILPLSYMTYKRSKEFELRRNLRLIRSAIDDYKKLVDDGRIALEIDGTGYPPNLETLVAGVDSNDPDPIKFKFLRRIPIDPMTENGEWGLRSYADAPDSDIWGGQDVYDIYTESEEQALDGTFYRDW